MTGISFGHRDVVQELLSLHALFVHACGHIGRTGNARCPEVKVMSFNIRYGSARDDENRWENRRDLVFDVLHEQQSDVVGLQEAERFQLDDIRGRSVSF